MLAVPYRAELRARAIGAAAGLLLAFVVAVGLIAVAGRLDDLNLHWLDAIVLPAAVLVAAGVYTGRRRRLRERLVRPRALDDDAERAAPARVRWLTMGARGLAGGLLLGGFSLLVDFEIDNLAVILAIALGGVLGEDAAGGVIVGRYEREHGRTVYRLEDPPGTEAGLGWLSQARE